MRHVNRLGGAARNGRNQRSRSMALVATFLLLVAGAVVSAAPGLMSASATSGTSTEQGQNEHECEAEHGHHHGNETEDESQGDDESQAQDQSQAEDDSQAQNGSQAENPNHGDGDNDADDDDGDNDADDNHNDNQNCLATLTVFKTIGDDTHGGFLTGDDFQLLVDGVPQAQSVPAELPAGVHIVGEVQQAGYKLQAILCKDDNINADVHSYDGAIDLAPGQHVTCNVINDEIAPTITMHKEVVNN